MFGQGRGGVEVPLVVRQGGRVAQRPAVVRRLADHLDPTGAGGAAEDLGDLRVRRVVRDVGDVVLVDVDPERVPEAHRVDLRAGVRRPGLEEVAGRDRVRPVALDVDPQQLAAQVVRVLRRAPRIHVRGVVPAAFLAGGDGDSRRGAGQGGAVSGHLRDVLLRRRAAEVDRPGAGAGHGDVIEVGERLEGRLHVRVDDRDRDRRRGLAVEAEREAPAGRVGHRDGLALVRELVVERPEAAGVAAAGGGVVAGHEPEVVVLVEGDVAGDVAAGAAVHSHLQDLLLGRQVEVWFRGVNELEPAQLEVALPLVPHRRIGAGVGRVPGRGLRRVRRLHGHRRVVEVDPPVRGEVVVHRRAVHAVFAVVVDGDVGDDLVRARGGIDEAHVAESGGLDDPPVRQDVEADRLPQAARVGRERGHLVVRQDGGAAVAAADPGSPADGTGEVGAEGTLGVGGRGVAAGGVERAAAAVVLAPHDGMVVTHRAAGVSVLVERGEHVRGTSDVGGEVVPLVGPGPVFRQAPARGVHPVRHLDRRAGHGGGAGRPGAEQVGQERPVRLGLDRRVDAQEAAALVEVGLERGLLGVVEHVPGRVEEDDRPVQLEVRGVELAGVVGDIDVEPVLGAELGDRADAGARRGMLLGRRLREDEHLVLDAAAVGRRRCRRARRHAEQRGDERGTDQRGQAQQVDRLAHGTSSMLRAGDRRRALVRTASGVASGAARTPSTRSDSGGRHPDSSEESGRRGEQVRAPPARGGPVGVRAWAPPGPRLIAGRYPRQLAMLS